MRIAGTSAIALCLVSPILLFAVSTENTESSEATPKTYPVIYAVSDLPVWRNQGNKIPQFAPDVLTAYLRSAIDPGSWNSGAEIQPIAKNASLVITQTQTNHKKIADVLKIFRETNPKEAAERVGNGQSASTMLVPTTEDEAHGTAVETSVCNKDPIAKREYKIHDIITVTAAREESVDLQFFDYPKESNPLQVETSIVEVRPNGNLVINACREVLENGNLIKRKLTGEVRPLSVQSSNSTVPLSEVADLRLERRSVRLARP